MQDYVKGLVNIEKNHDFKFGCNGRVENKMYAKILQ